MTVSCRAVDTRPVARVGRATALDVGVSRRLLVRRPVEMARAPSTDDVAGALVGLLRPPATAPGPAHTPVKVTGAGQTVVRLPARLGRGEVTGAVETPRHAFAPGGPAVADQDT